MVCFFLVVILEIVVVFLIFFRVKFNNDFFLSIYSVVIGFRWREVGWGEKKIIFMGI